MNDPKNTALLVLLPSACRLRVILGAQIKALGMKRKPRCREGEETGECAAELEVMEVLVVVITMFCSSCAPLSLTHTLSFSLSRHPLCLPLRKGFRINHPPLTKNPDSTQPRHPWMTSLYPPPGEYVGRKGADSRTNTNSVES